MEKFPDATTPTPRARHRVDLLEVRSREARATDHDRDACLDCLEGVRLHRRRGRVVDEDVDAPERIVHSAVDRNSERGATQRLAEISPGRGPADGGDELEIGRPEDGGDERPPGPARGARDPHGQGTTLHALALDELDPVAAE
jgi:hypothetical protein